ncbi:MAG TPA: SDR family oxidoreductase, partial [Gemmatimonadaceae bacterium]|nr:SDR family oxidoreductase [Gemmatimonadaceae bacterium]
LGALTSAAESLGPLAIPLACDVADPSSMDAAVRLIRDSFGEAPDVVVNNAGVFELATVERTDPNDFARAIEVNLVGPFRLVRAFLPEMRARQRGHIISIGSIADRVAFPENGAYAASKFGLRGLHEVLRAELVGTGVRATLVSPASVDTPLWDAVDPDNRAGFSPRSAMLRPSAVADAVVFAVTQPLDVNIDELRLSRS